MTALDWVNHRIGSVIRLMTIRCERNEPAPTTKAPIVPSTFGQQSDEEAETETRPRPKEENGEKVTNWSVSSLILTDLIAARNVPNTPMSVKESAEEVDIGRGGSGGREGGRGKEGKMAKG